MLLSFFYAPPTRFSIKKTPYWLSVSGTIVGTILVLHPAHAAPPTNLASPPATCDEQYFSKQAPQILNPKLSSNLMPLCFNGFAVMYSGLSNTALWSAEHLTRDRITQANNLERVDNFHPEPRLPANMQAQLADYTRSGYDRGHLSPNGDMADTTQQYDSFSLANIVPQNPQNNRNLWRDIESRTRSIAIKYGEVYVVTGVAFTGDNVKQLNGRILIPTFMYKAIYVPSLQQAGVYYAPNDASQRVEAISLAELNNRIHINAFPAVNSTIQQIAMDLPITNIGTNLTTPAPTQTTQAHKSNPNVPDTMLGIITNLFMLLIKWLINLIK